MNHQTGCDGSGWIDCPGCAGTGSSLCAEVECLNGEVECLGCPACAAGTLRETVQAGIAAATSAGAVQAQRVCLTCGCTESTPCDDDGHACSWAVPSPSNDGDVCTKCARLFLEKLNKRISKQ